MQKNKKGLVSLDEKELFLVSSISFKKGEEKNFVVKDNFWTKDFFTTASSNFLLNFQTKENSTVINELQEYGYKLVGKTALDEFACGGTGLFVNTGKLSNPIFPKRIVGGSSSGSAIAVAKGYVKFALGHDTGDSVRRPAAYCGIVGFKPSYGSISRFGLIPMASSLDTVGILSVDVPLAKEIFKIINKKDYRDLTTCVRKQNETIIKKGKIAFFSEFEKLFLDKKKKNYDFPIEKIRKEVETLGWTVELISIPEKIKESLLVTYLALCSSELLSHLNALQGITFGNNEEEISIEKKRSNYLGIAVKERLLLGAYFFFKQGDCLKKAHQIRNLVKTWLDEIFLNYDFFIFPSFLGEIPKITEIEEGFYKEDLLWYNNLLLLANLSGIPSISIPVIFTQNSQFSLNINSNFGQDYLLLDFAEQLENRIKNSN